jgi:hypothetical protein
MWRQLTRIDPNSSDYARTFTERPNGDLLITTFSGKLFEFSHGQFTELPPPPGVKGEGYLGGVDEEGHWWAVHNKFVGRFESGRWVSMISLPQDPGNATGLGRRATAGCGSCWVISSAGCGEARKSVA